MQTCILYGPQELVKPKLDSSNIESSRVLTSGTDKQTCVSDSKIHVKCGAFV